MHIALRYRIGVLAYSVSCVALHGLLHKHYIDSCHSWLSSLSSIEPSAYCTVVRKALSILQASPLLVTSAVITGAPLIDHHAAWRPDG